MTEFEWPWEKREREKREERHRLERIEEDERRILHEEERIERDEREILRELQHRAQSATLVIRSEKGELLVPAQLIVGQSAESVYTEFSLPAGGGVAVPPAGPIAFAVSDGTIVSVDPVTGHIVALAAGTATVTGSDAANGLNASDTVTVTGVTAQSATLVITPNNDAPSGAPTPAALKK